MRFRSFQSRRLNLFALKGFPALVVVLTTFDSGCNKGAPVVAPQEAPAVQVSQPIERIVEDTVDFTGRTVAVNSVNIVPRVTGYTARTPFLEGSEVNAGDLLFEIDPRPYQAQYDQAESQVSLQLAQLNLAISTFNRYSKLAKDTPGAVTPQELEQYQASVEEAKARVAAAKKSLEVYTLNKDFTRVIAPIWADKSLLSKYRQPGESGSDVTHDGRLARPDFRLFRHG